MNIEEHFDNILSEECFIYNIDDITIEYYKDDFMDFSEEANFYNRTDKEIYNLIKKLYCDDDTIIDFSKNISNWKSEVSYNKEDIINDLNSPSEHFFVIRKKNKFAGQIIFNIENEDKLQIKGLIDKKCDCNYSISYFIMPEFRKQQIMKKVLNLILNKIKKGILIIAYADKKNIASIKLLDKFFIKHNTGYNIGFFNKPSPINNSSIEKKYYFKKKIINENRYYIIT